MSDYLSLSHFTADNVAVFIHRLQRLMLLFNMIFVVITYMYVFANNGCFVFRSTEMIENTLNNKVIEIFTVKYYVGLIYPGST